ncbi:TetR/AcrR family transcriptional regulator [Mycolicibacterium sp. P1-5]|uniref:TetR/AcrR family transcriptional regulator n=1 Tax=Mycolicibacterium sp. P1-5 TaxID=2024617 RepID=UPI0011EC0C37|nr:TetR family transcriptional regulator [Mycolicibacterium sp. P1-5]KAA0107887.1 TetR family transcriptional regulator [Mycolicibacterium sp. P1-5]
MAIVAKIPVPGLRELKKQRTRATLIDVAVALFIDQGYDNTTVEQIATTAEVAPRTFSRYFSGKDAVIIAILEGVAGDVAAVFARQPLDISPYEALARAHLETFGSEQYSTSTSFEQMQLLLRILNSAPALGLAPFMFRAGGFHHQAAEVAAQRMGVASDHPSIRILFDTWAVVMGVACHGLGTAGGPPIEPDVVCHRIESVYALFNELRAPQATPGQTPAGVAAE